MSNYGHASYYEETVLALLANRDLGGQIDETDDDRLYASAR
jgi:hypothetical protein